MNYYLLKGVEIIPFNSQNNKMGVPRLSTVEFTFHEHEILDRITEGGLTYFRLPLGANATVFDSYLVLAADLQETP